MARNISAQSSHKQHLYFILYFMPILMVYIYPNRAFARSSCNEINNLKYVNVTSYSFVISWSLEHCSGEGRKILEPIKVTSTFKKFLACDILGQSNEISSSSSDLLEQSVVDIRWPKNKTHVKFESLMPYSEYEVEVESVGQGVKKQLTVKTKSAMPGNKPKRDKSQSTRATTQAITFYWQSSDASTCQQQNGVTNGFRVELWGLNPWVISKPNQDQNLDRQLIHVKNIGDQVFQYYAQHLKPFTNYSLKVFNKNRQDEHQPNAIHSAPPYNNAKYLEIHKRTDPIVPNIPSHLDAHPLSDTSVNLRWVPTYPPTGLVERYTLRIGKLNEAGECHWTSPVQIYPETDLSSCANTFNKTHDTFNNPYCYRKDDLLPETAYCFSVKVFNVNVAKGSDFSEIFSCTTDPKVTTSVTIDPSLSSTRKTTDPPITQTMTPHAMTNESAVSTGTTVIIILAIGVLLLLIVCFILRRKIRRTTEKIILRSGGTLHTDTVSWLSAADSSCVNFGPHGPVLNIESENVTTRNVSVSSSCAGRPSSPSFESHVIRSVVNQIEEIQSRRLPEAPPLALSINSAVSVPDTSGEILWGLELQKMDEKAAAKTENLPLPPVRRSNYCDPDDDARLQNKEAYFHHPSTTYKQEPPDIIQHHKQLEDPAKCTIKNKNLQQNSLETHEREEGTDTYGYLRPTFLRPPSFQDPPDSPNVEKPPIPTESYCQVTSTSLGLPDQCDLFEEKFSSNHPSNVRPSSNESELSFSNLREYNVSPNIQSASQKFEQSPLISQNSMHV